MITIAVRQRTHSILPLAAILVALAASSPAQAGIDFSNYHTPAQVDTELTNLQTRFPGFATVSTIGSSLEGRPIKAVEIATSALPDAGKGDVIFVALHHARKWLSTETALYIAEQLLEQYPTNAQLHADIDHLRIWVIPVLNPDGYAYTTTSDRYWRKNRRDNGDGTFGVDLNRNYSYQWGLLSGSSATTSDDTYHGTGAFSEPETQLMRDFANSRANLKALVSYHTYSELVLRPWSYTTTDPPGAATLTSIDQRQISLIDAVHGESYGPTIWYTSSGEATDYFWNQSRVAAFTVEERPTLAGGSGDGGLAGFSPPPAQIVPACEENLPAAFALIHDAGGREVWIRDYVGDTGAEPSAVWSGGGWSHVFWESPDISTEPAALTEGSTVTLNVTVQNDTGATIDGVTLEAYWADPSISLDFPGLSSHPITSETVSVPPGGATFHVPWTVPTGTNGWGERHWCVGALVKHAHDMPLTTLAERSSNIAQRNFSVAPSLAGETLVVSATNFLGVDAELEVLVDQQSLPQGWRIVVPAPVPPATGAAGAHCAAIERKARLLGATGRLLRAGESVLVPVHVEPPPGAGPGATADVRIQGALRPLVAGRRTVSGTGYTYHVVVGAAPATH